MFAKRIGDESLGATPRATNALDAAAVGERLPLLHREGQAPDALASARGRKSRSTAVSLAAVGGALAMVVVCGVALANSATGAKHTSELARADAARARVGGKARRAQTRPNRAPRAETRETRLAGPERRGIARRGGGGGGGGDGDGGGGAYADAGGGADCHCGGAGGC